jgi:Domain of unknown function (DUF4352)
MRFGLIVLVAVGLGVVASGCGGSSSSEGTTAAAAAAEAEGESTGEEEVASSETFDRDNYALLVSDPDAHKGAEVRIVGRVFNEVEQDANGTYFQMFANPKDSEWNTIVGVADTSLRLSDGDFVRVVGTVTGQFSGENAFGGDVNAVKVAASSVRKVDATAAASTPRRVLPKRRASEGGIVVTVQKVEFADDETRVFVAVKNNSGADVNLYASSGKAVSGSRQYDSTFSLADYPQVSSDIAPGAFTTGVVVFPTMNEKSPLRLIFEGYSDNSNVGNYGSVRFEFNWPS